MAKTIVMIGTLDTKGDQFAYLKKLIEERGHRVITMDVGVLGEPPFVPAISSAEVARAGGTEPRGASHISGARAHGGHGQDGARRGETREKTV